LEKLKAATSIEDKYGNSREIDRQVKALEQRLLAFVGTALVERHDTMESR
jgi:hypothetical protein